MSGDPYIDSLVREIADLKSENMRLKDKILVKDEQRVKIISATIRFLNFLTEDDIWTME